MFSPRATCAGRCGPGPLALVLVLLSAACQQTLHHGLEEGEANEIVAVLETAGIGADKAAQEGSDPPTFTVSVRQSDAPRALTALTARGLPRGRRAGLGQVYGHPSLIPSATEETARYLGALSAELQKTLETIDGVVASRVHLVLEQRDAFATDGKPRTPARASVLLKVHTGQPPATVEDIQRLLAGSVPGLEATAVTVVYTPAPEAPRETAALVPMGPLRVSPGSRPLLLVAMAAAAAALAGIALLLLRTTRKLSTLERELTLRGAGGR